MLNLVSLSTQSLASCVNYFVWNCLTCFSNTKIGSVTSFSILFNFQGPVRLSLDADDLIILPQKRFFVKLFFSRLLNVLNLDASKFLGADRNFSASIGSFQRLRAEASEVILLSQRLALKYNTTPSAFCQHFSASFFLFFQILFSPGSVRLFFLPFRTRKPAGANVGAAFVSSGPPGADLAVCFRLRYYYIYIILRCKGGPFS